MRAWNKLFLFAAIVGTSSCGGPPPRFVNTQHQPPRIISLWVDQRAGLSLSDTLAGCNVWNEEDVRCVAAANPLQADIVVVLDSHPCAPGDDGKVVLAHADEASVIGVRLDCFYHDDTPGSGFDAEEYRLVMAHEVGHELGIWEHVRTSCSDKKNPAKKTPDGRPVCGRAIMNPDYDVDVKALTPADALAYDLRDKAKNALSGPAEVPRKPCTYAKKVR